MKIGKTEKYINERLDIEGSMISIIIDPLDWPSPDAAISAGRQACEAGADIIAVGGSIGAQGELLDVVTSGIKEVSNVPVVLFPGNIGTITRFADAIYFMSLLNSRNPYWISQAQMLAAPILHRMGIEPLPIGYIVVAPGGTVGWVGDANLIPRDKPAIAAALALSGEYSGSRIIFTDAGSASKEGPVPIEMVEAVSKAISIPYLVAGGIRTPQQAADIIRAGADWVQVGTAAEKAKDTKKVVEAFVKAVKAEGKARA